MKNKTLGLLIILLIMNGFLGDILNTIIGGIKSPTNPITSSYGNMAAGAAFSGLNRGMDAAYDSLNKSLNKPKESKPVQQPKQTSKQLPKQNPTPQQAKVDNYQPNITIPYSQTGQPYRLPNDTAQIVLNAFNDINQATPAATVLNHPPMMSPISGKITHGENASFKPVVDATNTDGSVDRGLFRINSNTFNGVMAHPFWGKIAREKFGINNWEDMNDPQKNAFMAKIIYERQGWGAWVAAPPALINQGQPNLGELSAMIGGNK